jgi:Protein of unknown function (DUF2911)/Tetratricopeptide repeat
MKRHFSFTLLALVWAACPALAQLTMPHGGGSKKASVSEQIGLTKLTIDYDRPAVRGREGKVWGTDVAPFGFTDQGFGTSKSAPWRAGANENTVFTTSSEVKVGGKTLPAGKYGLFMALAQNEVTVIFSKDYQAWGSYFYDPAKDVLRIQTKPMKADASQEYLQYEFVDQTDNSATVLLAWEKWRIPFRVEVDVVGGVVASLREELKGDRGFSWQAWHQAAAYCLEHNTHLEEALTWAEGSISMPYLGEKNFSTLSVKSGILAKLGRQAEADALMKEALPLGQLMEVHGYGRQLLAAKKPKEALEVFKLNAQKHPTNPTASIGLVRAYSALGDYKNALKFANQALAQKPDEANQKAVEGMIAKLKAGQDIN